MVLGFQSTGRGHQLKKPISNFASPNRRPYIWHMPVAADTTSSSHITFPQMTHAQKALAFCFVGVASLSANR
jgi:hypothetical protein